MQWPYLSISQAIHESTVFKADTAYYVSRGLKRTFPYRLRFLRTGTCCFVAIYNSPQIFPKYYKSPINTQVFHTVVIWGAHWGPMCETYTLLCMYFSLQIYASMTRVRQLIDEIFDQNVHNYLPSTQQTHRTFLSSTQIICSLGLDLNIILMEINWKKGTDPGGGGHLGI